MLYELIKIFLITLVPTLELRASIPYGILFGEVGIVLTFIVAVISNILLAFFVWWIVAYVMQYFLKINFVKKNYDKLVLRSQKKIKPYVDKYGILGLAIFIGVPLPGSGVYTGGLGAYFLGFKFKDYFKASVVGVLIAAVLVTLAVVIGDGTLELFIKLI